MKLSFLIQLVFLLLLIVGVYALMTNSIGGRSKMILIIFVLVIGIYLFHKLPLFRSYNLIVNEPQRADVSYEIQSDTLMDNKKPGPFTTSMWIYIEDWNQNYGEQKSIFKRVDDTDVLQEIKLDAHTNDLIIDINGIETKIENINIQKWVNITVAVTHRNMDVYINGKLVRSKVFDAPINFNENKGRNITICADGTNGPGFDGYISKVRYYPYFITPQKAWDIYREGFGDVFASALNKYNMSVTFYEDAVEKKKYWVF